MHFAAKRSIIVSAPNGYFLYCITTVMIVKTISAREGLFSMLTNYHTHTTRCGHAEGTEEEYILTALRCGYKVLGFSDHTPWAYATPGFVSHIRMLPAQLDDYVLTLRSLREKYADRLHLHIGLEAEYFPAYLGWLKEETERLGIEYLILGCHYDTTDEQDAKARRFGGSEYNMAGLTLQRRPDGSLGYTRDEFWRIAAEYPVRAIVGCDAHAPSELDVVPLIEEKRAFLQGLGIPVLDTLPGLE